MDKSQVGIITYQRAVNYGAILQTYALQNVIKELGYDVKTIDYRNQILEDRHKKMKFSSIKGIKDLIKYFLLSKDVNKKHDKFRRFGDMYLNLSDPVYSQEDLARLEKEYDLFITGSDQVWNYKINGLDSNYFLDFVENKSKKRTYAASFGISEIPEELKQNYKDLLMDFNNILIREKQGAEIISDLLSKESQVVLDPTMLLTKDKWLTFIDSDINYNDKYILVYAFGNPKKIKELALEISIKTGFRILWISTTPKFSKKIKFIKSAGPEEFLTLFNNAEYIITNSFHGTAFSINFNKQFSTELLPETTGVNSRLEDILELFGLQERKILSTDSSIIESKIDYKKVNLKLEEEREKSISLLRDAIENNMD